MISRLVNWCWGLTASARPWVPKTTSISSRLNRFVSGTTNHMKTTPKNVINPKNMKVPYVMCSIMSGVICPTIKLVIQFAEAPMAIPYALDV